MEASDAEQPMNTTAYKLQTISQIGEALLTWEPDPVPRCRLLRDVFTYPADDPLLVASQQTALNSRWVTELAAEQAANGSWGRFHSQDSTLPSRFPTTEAALRRALALGLDAHTPLLAKAVGYMERHLQGIERWSDPPEKHEGWPINIRVITAGTLARINCQHPLLDEFWQTWAEIVHRVFHDGSYDPVAERQAQRDVYGIVTKDKYMKLWMAYPLLILSATRCRLPAAQESALLRWLWDRPEGIYYVCDGSLSQFPEIGSKRFPRWLAGLELLSRFDQWRTVATDAIDWLWTQRNPDGFWDGGSGVGDALYFPLSDSWRRPRSRQLDWSVRILALLTRFYQLPT